MDEWAWFFWTTYAAIVGGIVLLILRRRRSRRASRLGIAALTLLLIYYTGLKLLSGPTTTAGALLERAGLPVSAVVVDRWVYTLSHTVCYGLLIVAVAADRGRRQS